MHWVGHLPVLHRIRLWYINLIEEPVLEPLAAYWSKLKLLRQKSEPDHEAGKPKLFDQSIFGVGPLWSLREIVK